MDAFWTLARQMLRYKGTLALALVFSFISASGLALGLAAMSPIMKILGDRESGTSLVTIAEHYNATHQGVLIPQGVIDVLPADPFLGVLIIIVGLAVMAVFGATTNFLHQYLSMTVAIRTVTHLRQQMFRHTMALPLGRVVERGPAEFVARIVRDAAELERGFRALLSKSVAQITKGLLALAVAVFFSWQVALTAPFIGLALWIILRKLGKRIRRGKRASLKAQEGLLRIATEAIQGLRAVKANTGERTATWRFLRENKQAMQHEMRVRTARALSGPLAEMLGSIMIGFLTVIFAGQILLTKTLEFEHVIVALGSLAVAGACFKPVSGIANEIYAAAAPANRLYDVLGAEREVPRRAQFVGLPRHRRSIEFDTISFTYPGANQPALREVSLKFAHGERVAIVGPNGCGKTTLLSMIPRLLRPATGRVLIDDVDIESVSLRRLRRQIGVVTQETILFRGSVAENIAFGADGVTRERVIDAAKRAHADEFIREMPGGYDADVLEQGASLSGGQRQRLAIARAILREPAILILDEATSQIDSESERHINEALAEFCRGRTALLIAHRLSTVLSADRIVVMDHGRIIDDGRHGDLLDRCDLYQRLARTQLVDSH